MLLLYHFHLSHQLPFAGFSPYLTNPLSPVHPVNSPSRPHSLSQARPTSMAHLKSALSQDDPFLASLSTVQATEKATATSAGFQTVDEYRKGLAWYQSIRTSPKVASFGGATTNQLLSHVTSNPHIFKWPASGSLFEVTLTGKGKHTARESGTTNTVSMRLVGSGAGSLPECLQGRNTVGTIS